jgi:hypothetical protein
MSKTLGFIPLHYGKEYLEQAIKAVDPCIDQLLVLYTSKPSYGYRTGVECPETEEELKDIVFNSSRNPMWINVTDSVNQEGEHRAAAIEYAKLHGFDQMISFDSDEVWDTDCLRKALEDAAKLPNDRVGVSFGSWYHFWRSFGWVCRDWFVPVRIFNIKREFQKEEGCVDGRIYHFGYAQSETIMRYKWEIHGHKSELRENWTDTYFNWKPGMNDVHPVSNGLWNPEKFERETLPEILRKHPNYEKDLI